MKWSTPGRGGNEGDDVFTFYRIADAEELRRIARTGKCGSATLGRGLIEDTI
jgi:hypothetical protein